MKKKVKTILFVFIVIGVVILNITYKNKNEVTKTKRKKQNNLAIMIKEDGASDYTKSSSKDIPKGNYVLNRDKSYCKNNGVIGDYDNTLGKISFSFIGTDSCYLYFDVITDTEKPVISNLLVNDTTVTATLTDNVELSGYGISTSNSTEPSSWTTISGTSYNLSTTITTEGTYYLWVKDSSDNKTISEAIDLEKKGYQTILINNGGGATTVDAAISYIKEKGTPNFANTATTNEGMYAAEDDLGTSYYFRGAVNNNWVKFGKDSSNKDMYWRIIRINGDGSIRIIYSGITAPASSTATVMTGTDTQISTAYFNSSYTNASYVGYMYTNGQQHGNNTSSTIKTTLENWYAGTILKDNDLVADQIFCNDRSVTSGMWSSSPSSNLYYAPYTRLYTNKSPKLTCTTLNDKFSINTSNGNGVLTYPVGLITADEVAMAGGVFNISNTTYYLYTNQSYWSGSPGYFYSSSSFVTNLFVNSSGSLSLNAFFIASGIRPVISLSSKAKLSGNGTYNDVYTVN